MGVQLVRHPSRRHPPIVFAQGGASAHAEPDTRAAIELALTLGASGLATTAQRTADGAVVLSERTSIGRWPRRASISTSTRSELSELLSLDDVWSLAPSSVVAVNVADRATGDAVLDAAAAANRIGPLWLCAPDLDALGAWAETGVDAHLVHLTHIGAMRAGPERHAADLGRLGVTGVSMPGSEWTGGLTTLFHRFELDAVARDVRVERVVTALVRMGIDAVMGDDVETMVEVVSADAGSA